MGIESTPWLGNYSHNRVKSNVKLIIESYTYKRAECETKNKEINIRNPNT